MLAVGDRREVVCFGFVMITECTFGEYELEIQDETNWKQNISKYKIEI